MSRAFYLASMAVIVLSGGGVQAQSSSLFGPAGQRPPLRLDNNSWYFIRVDPPRQLQINDIVTVVVDEKAQTFAEGEVDRRKTAILNAKLADWIKFDGLDITPDPQPNGDPRVNGALNARYRAESELDTAEGMKFRIAARVVDIRPNGHLVLEAHREIKSNNEVWKQSLTGIVRPEDVLPNNTVLSEDVSELRIDKEESGHVRDGYRRGWLLKAIDKFSPF